MKKNKIVIVGLMAMLCGSFAHAQKGDASGNGGDGIVSGNSIYLLDFFESGVELNPYFNTDIAVNDEIKQRIVIALSSVGEVVQNLVSQKLSEVNQVSPISAMSILNAIENYTFRFVSSELLNINDEDMSIQYDRSKLVQLAVRKDRSILIDRTLWSKLDPKHQAGLIFHEVLYAMTPVVSSGRGHKQPSFQARQLTGYLFNPDLAYKGIKGLLTMTRGESFFPVDSRPVLEVLDRGKNQICIPAVSFESFTGGILTSIIVSANDSMVNEGANQFCNDYKNYLFKNSHILEILAKKETTTYDRAMVVKTCVRSVTFDFFDYYEPQDGIKSGYKSVKINSTRYFPNAKDEEWKHGMIPTSVNTGTRRHPKLEWSIDTASCVDKVKALFKKYSEN